MKITGGKTAAQKRRRRLALILAAAGGAGAAFATAFYLESFVVAAPCCFAAWPMANPLQSERALERADPRGVNADLQERTARQVLSARPVDPSGWLRLAHADALRNGKLTGQGLYALSTSYTMTAFGGRNAGWRVAFGLDHWYDLDEATRRQVQIELKVLSRDYLRRDNARRLIGGITNPVGRYLAYQQDMLPLPAPKSPQDGA